MGGWKDFMGEEGYERLEKARFLSEDQSKDDPEDEPYKSKYEARKITEDIKERLMKYLGDRPTQTSECSSSTPLSMLLICVDLKLASNYMDTEELSTADELLTKCFTSLDNEKLTPDVVNICQHTLNQLGVLWTGRQENEKALDFFKQAEHLYMCYKRETDTPPKSLEEYLRSDQKEENLILYREKSFENTFTHTLYYMAQVYAKLDEKEKSAACCHMTLERQLESRVYDPVDWALNAATLSQYYVICDDFPQARHCLSSAEFIFNNFLENADQIDESKKEMYNKTRADIQRCWVKYGLALLESSRDYWMSETNTSNGNEESCENTADASETSEACNDPSASGSSSQPTEQGNHNEEPDPGKESEAIKSRTENKNTFTDCLVSGENELKNSRRFNLELTTIENQIADKCIHDFEEAKPVFLKIQNWLAVCREFYSLTDYCSDNIELVQDCSKAYKLLSFFELSLERQCKMHKRRVDMLTLLLGELNPQYYLLVCRQLMFEIADIYSEMLDLKLAIMESTNTTPTPHAVKKINLLAEQSISSYQAYVDSLKGDNGELPEKFGENDVRPALVAYFCMGRLFSKFIFTETAKRIAFTKKSLECYKCLVDYCKRYPESRKVVSSELKICEELVSLLPMKIERMRQQSEGW